MNQAPVDLAAHRKRRAERRHAQPGNFDRSAAVRRIEAGDDQSAASRAFGPADVPCARCGAAVVANARRCPHCGVHFSGYAEDFSPSAAGRSRRTTMIVAALLIVCLVLAAIFDWMD